MTIYRIELVTDDSPAFDQCLGEKKEAMEKLTKMTFYSDSDSEIEKRLPKGINIGMPDESDYNFVCGTVNFPILLGTKRFNIGYVRQIPAQPMCFE